MTIPTIEDEEEFKGRAALAQEEISNICKTYGVAFAVKYRTENNGLSLKYDVILADATPLEEEVKEKDDVSALT